MTHEKQNSQYFGLTKTLPGEWKGRPKAHICYRILHPKSKEDIDFSSSLIVFNRQKSKYWKTECLNIWKAEIISY